MKIFLLTLCFFVFTTSYQLRATSLFAAQEDKQLVSLTKQIIEAKSAGDLYASFAQLKELYYKECLRRKLITEEEAFLHLL